MATRIPPTKVSQLRTREQVAQTAMVQASLTGLGSAMPVQEATLEDLYEWWQMTAQLDKLKNDEMALRKKLARFIFQNPREGTNTVEFPDGALLKMKHTINRKPDPAGIQAIRLMKVGDVRPQLQALQVNHQQWPDDMPLTQAMMINLDSVFKYDPSLVASEYKELTAEQMAIIDMSLVISDGSPALEVVPPKTK